MILFPDGAKVHLQKGTIHLEKNQPFLRRYLTALYREGYDEVEVTSDDVIKQSLVQNAVDMLLGFEILESYPKKIVVRNVAVPKHSEFHNIFKRLFLVNINIGLAVLEDIKTGQFTHGKEVAELQKTVHKLCNFCQRVLIQSDLDSRADTFNKYHFSSELQNIGDYLALIGISTGKLKRKTSPQITISFESCLALMERLYKNHTCATITTIIELRSMRETAYHKIFIALENKKNKKKEMELLSCIFGILGCIKSIENKIYQPTSEELLNRNV